MRYLRLSLRGSRSSSCPSSSPPAPAPATPGRLEGRDSAERLGQHRHLHVERRRGPVSPDGFRLQHRRRQRKQHGAGVPGVRPDGNGHGGVGLHLQRSEEHELGRHGHRHVRLRGLVDRAEPDGPELGLWLTDEGQAYQQHWINATTGNSGHLDDDSNVEPQLYEWAQAAPSSCPDANGVIAGSPNFAGEWDAWQRCQLSQHYVSDFYYSPVMYPVTDTDQLTDGEWESEDVAVWADGAGLPLGSNGLNFEWAQDSTISDNPPASTTPQAQIAMNILYGENYGNLPHPPYYELQSVDSQTAYCTKSDLADCWYYQQRQPPSQYPHPDCYPNYDPAEDVYLAQVFGSITTLEVYYDDLDEISGHSGLSTAYSDWETNTFGNDFYSQASQNCST